MGHVVKTRPRPALDNINISINAAVPVLETPNATPSLFFDDPDTVWLSVSLVCMLKKNVCALTFPSGGCVTSGIGQVAFTAEGLTQRFDQSCCRA